jgi:hypothetical protein
MHFAWGVAAMGALIGLFVAWSQSPIAPELVTALLALVGGASGIFAFKLDLTKEENKNRLALAGICLFALCTATLIFAVVGAVSKPRIGRYFTPSLPSIADATSPIDAALTRARFMAVGATPDEIEAIFKKNAGAPELTPAQIQAINEWVTATNGSPKEQERSDLFVPKFAYQPPVGTQMPGFFYLPNQRFNTPKGG